MGSLLGCNWPNSDWTKSLVCKDDVSQGFHYSDNSALVVSQEKPVPCQPSGRRTIPSGRSSVHISSHPDDVPYRLDTRQTKHHSSGRRGFPSGPFTISRSFCSSLHPFERLSSPSGRRSVIDQLQNFFPSSNKGRLIQPSGRTHT
jgi:hypothetical protein